MGTPCPNTAHQTAPYHSNLNSPADDNSGHHNGALFARQLDEVQAEVKLQRGVITWLKHQVENLMSQLAVLSEGVVYVEHKGDEHDIKLQKMRERVDLVEEKC